MSAQDVIADQIEGEVLGSGWDVAATRDQANAMARRAVKALETLGYAVVKLPEQMADSDGGLSDVATFDGANTIYYAIDGRVEDDSLNRWQNLDDARGDAAALLAAAARAEEAQS